MTGLSAGETTSTGWKGGVGERGEVHEDDVSMSVRTALDSLLTSH